MRYYVFSFWFGRILFIRVLCNFFYSFSFIIISFDQRKNIIRITFDLTGKPVRITFVFNLFIIICLLISFKLHLAVLDSFRWRNPVFDNSNSMGLSLLRLLIFIISITRRSIFQLLILVFHKILFHVIITYFVLLRYFLRIFGILILSLLSSLNTFIKAFRVLNSKGARFLIRFLFRS